jgi:hypothetical protein
MLYTVDVTISNGFPFIGIEDENNHRTLLSPSDECLIEDEELQEFIKTTFTPEIKAKHKEYIDSLKPSKEEENKNRIQSLKDKANAIIVAKYPYWKQLNIMREGGTKLEDMETYISKVQTLSNQAEEEGLWSNQVDWTIN